MGVASLPRGWFARPAARDNRRGRSPPHPAGLGRTASPAFPPRPALVVRVLVLFLSQQLTSFSRFCKIKVVQTQSCKGSQGIYRENSLLLPRAGCEKPENICNEVVEGYNLHVE